MFDPFGLGERRGNRHKGRQRDGNGKKEAGTTVATEDDSNYYAVLGVANPEGWTGEELATLYRRACREYHPDKHPASEEHAQQFKRLQEAYAVLGDTQRRAMYDRWLTSGLTDSVSWDQWERHLMVSHWRGESPKPKALDGTLLPESREDVQPTPQLEEGDSPGQQEGIDQKELRKMFRTYQI